MKNLDGVLHYNPTYQREIQFQDHWSWRRSIFYQLTFLFSSLIIIPLLWVLDIGNIWSALIFAAFATSVIVYTLRELLGCIAARQALQLHAFLRASGDLSSAYFRTPGVGHVIGYDLIRDGRIGEGDIRDPRYFGVPKDKVQFMLGFSFWGADESDSKPDID